MNNDNRRVLAELMNAQENGESIVLATVVQASGSVPRRAGAKMLVYEDGRISGTIGGGELEARVIAKAQDALRHDHPDMLTYSLVEPNKGDPGLCGGAVEVYLEPYLPPATLWVIGCGHVGQEVADLGHWLGFRVVVNDDRPELVTPEYIPHADVYLPGSIEEALAAHPVTRNTFITLLTRNVNIDRQILPQLAHTPAPYIGVMGSRRRWEHTKKLLLEAGLEEADLRRFHSPVGLELNAETPKEIAISILSEIVMLHRGGTGERMRTESHQQLAEG